MLVEVLLFSHLILFLVIVTISIFLLILPIKFCLLEIIAALICEVIAKILIMTPELHKDFFLL